MSTCSNRILLHTNKWSKVPIGTVRCGKEPVVAKRKNCGYLCDKCFKNYQKIGKRGLKELKKRKVEIKTSRIET